MECSLWCNTEQLLSKLHEITWLLLRFIVHSFDSERSGLVDESQCRSCSPGFYCSETGLSAVSGPCLPGQTENLVVSVIWKRNPSNIVLKCFSPGYYCLEGSKTATPMSSVSGGVCPAGHYCAEGSSVPTPCPAGSYQNETGGKGKDECKPCPLGKKVVTLYELNSAKLTFICTNSLSLSKDVFTVWMSLPGWFQDLSGQRECNPCPPGFYCQSLSPSPTSPLPCPAGYICPRDSPDSQPLPCPKGTYSLSQGLTTTSKNQETLWKRRTSRIILQYCLPFFLVWKEFEDE